MRNQNDTDGKFSMQEYMAKSEREYEMISLRWMDTKMYLFIIFNRVFFKKNLCIEMMKMMTKEGSNNIVNFKNSLTILKILLCQNHWVSVNQSLHNAFLNDVQIKDTSFLKERNFFFNLCWYNFSLAKAWNVSQASSVAHWPNFWY